MDSTEIDHNFEPQFRERSNTWPLRPSREMVEAHGDGSPASEDSNAADGQLKKEGVDPLGLTAKKSGSRRNAWGNLSYADLITKAIQSSPEKRLTLSQIYDWMVQNVPYFKDKGDSTSSAGWKNSIRHNLSLHSRFMRIQNEGTGKSSWWVINPDAKPGKAPRRRAGSMETKSYEKKRGRIKKKAEALRAALENGTSPLGGDEFFDSIVSPSSYSEFRQRTSSNASSCGGRLSPIQAGVETDLHDSQVPPMSPILWGAEDDNHTLYNGGGENFDLVDTLVGVMKISPHDSSLDAYNPNGLGPDYTSNAQSFMSAVGDYTRTHLPAPPPYPDLSPNTQAQSPLPLGSGSYTNLQPMGQSDMYGESVMEHMNSPAPLSVQQTHQQQLNSPERSQQNSPNPQAFAAHLSPQAPRASPALNSPLSNQLSPQQNRALLGTQRASPSLANSLQQQQQQQAANAQSILREALTKGGLGMFTTNVNSAFTMSPPNNINTTMLKMGLSHQQQQQHQQLQHQQQMQQQPPLRILSGSHSHPHFDSMNGLTSCGMVANSLASMLQTNGNNNNVPLDIDMDALINVPVDYDMDSLIKQELSLEGNLDFNFDSVVNGPTSATGQNIVH